MQHARYPLTLYIEGVSISQIPPSSLLQESKVHLSCMIMLTDRYAETYAVDTVALFIRKADYFLPVVLFHTLCLLFVSILTVFPPKDIQEELGV
jgi:hypothetical protein